MANTVVCPVCGETNAADMEFCHNCQSRLYPLPGSLGNENVPIQPGEPPTKKATGELEPLLPQWLRDARRKARETAAEDASKTDKEEQEPPAPAEPDLLAGLASQRDDEEEDIPDWLANITGATRKKKKPAQEESQVKWVELGHEPQESPFEGTSDAQAAERDELTDWFKQASSESQTADFRMPPLPPETGPSASILSQTTQEPETKPEPPAEDQSWLSRLDEAAATQPQTPIEPSPAREEAPDWLKRLQAEQAPPQQPAPPQAPRAADEDVPAWLREFGAEGTAPAQPQPPAPQEPLPEATLPDWLQDLQPAGQQETTPEPAADEPFIPTDVPDWLSSLEMGSEAPSSQQAEDTRPTSAESPGLPFTPDWLSSVGATTDMPQEPAQPPAAEEPAEQPMVPDWLSSLDAPQEQAATAEPEMAAGEPPVPAELPDWMAAQQLKQEHPAEPQPTDEAVIPTNLPDWLSSLGAPAQPFAAEAPTSPLLSEEMEQVPAEPPAGEPETPGMAFTLDAIPENDVDAVFASMRMPDWLSAVLPTTPSGEENAPAAAQEELPIGPAELPSWVQAMRPVESVMDAPAGGSEDTLIEKRGPLAGVRGVLPAIPGAVIPSSKPRPHSMKLDATEQQLAHAALLEQILAAETAPVPMRSGNILGSQKLTRWGISALLMVLLAAVVLGGTRIFALPGGVPNETVAAVQAVEAIPEDAPVLLIFDYQPSTVGEMEATGASLIDHLLLLKHPRLALLSTSPTGPALAEHFMNVTLANRAYALNQQYVDLGFLPGGLAGVYNFAQSPPAAVPLDARSQPVWQNAVLSGVTKFSDFAAVIVLTDTMEAGRSWVEQTTGSRGSSSMIFVAGAQAGPMLLPYVDSGQVNGMVSGIYGAAGAEQSNAGVPGFVRRYWDAYSIGLYAAIGLIVLGALWNLWLAFRERQMQGAR